jgi:hypothetical protein
MKEVESERDFQYGCMVFIVRARLKEHTTVGRARIES